MAIYPQASTLLFIFALYFATGPSTTAASQEKRCEVSVECDDGIACTLDICASSRCFNVASSKLSAGKPCNATSPTTTLNTLLAIGAKKTLSTKDRLAIVEISKTLLRDVHAHRQLHVAFLGIDPIPMLERLERRVADEEQRGECMSDLQFHERMLEIYKHIDDLHTQYRLPLPFNETRAVLPFTIQDFYEGSRLELSNNTRKFLVADIANGLELTTKSSFTAGVEVISWNGESIGRVVEEIGERSSAANAAARLRFGIQFLVSKRLNTGFLPASPSVHVGYVDKKGKKRVVQIDWIFLDLGQTQSNRRDPALFSDELGRHHADSAVLLRSTRSLADLDAVRKQKKGSEKRLAIGERMQIAVNESYSDQLAVELVGTSSGNIGRFRVINFNISDSSDEYLAECMRLFSMMPSTGVVVDVRGNPGGSGIAPFLTLLPAARKPIISSVDVLRVTPLMLKVATTKPEAGDDGFGMFAPTMPQAQRIGERYSGSVPLLSAEILTELQKGDSLVTYKGPLVLLFDGATYSAGDVITGIAQDNDLALVVGVDDATGAGGSSVLRYSSLQEDWPSLFPQDLPGGVEISCSMTREYRGGQFPEFRGKLMEYFGVAPDVRYYPSRRDRLEMDADLFEFLGEALVKRGKRENM